MIPETQKLDSTNIIDENPSDFDPSKLPNKLLDQLWLLAENRNMTELQAIVQEERYGRLEREVEARSYDEY